MKASLDPTPRTNAWMRRRSGSWSCSATGRESAFERAEANLERLRLRAAIGGMVAHATRYSNGAMIRPQEGDQMRRNNSLLSIFDPHRDAGSYHCRRAGRRPVAAGAGSRGLR